MRIAILSLNPGHNYGGILQSYALKTVLERMGHEVCVISQKRDLLPSFSILEIPRYIVRFYRKMFKGSDVRVFSEAYYSYRDKKVFKYTNKFCEEHLNLKKITSFSDIKQDEFDAIVVGSDQVWRPIGFSTQFASSITNAYLQFAKGWKIKRIAYAASFGTDCWEYTDEDTKVCRSLLRDFDAVSVREQSGVDLCKRYFDVEAIHLCDPVLLLPSSLYKSLIPSSTPCHNGKLLVYCLDECEAMNELVRKISLSTGYIPFDISPILKESYSISKQGMIPVESWLQAFYDAEFVVTDSFHACVFSLLFHKPFIVLANKNRGVSRIESLLYTFNLSRNLVYSSTEYTGKKIAYNYDYIDNKFMLLRNESLSFLKRSLS